MQEFDCWGCGKCSPILAKAVQQISSGKFSNQKVKLKWKHGRWWLTRELSSNHLGPDWIPEPFVTCTCSLSFLFLLYLLTCSFLIASDFPFYPKPTLQISILLENSPKKKANLWMSLLNFFFNISVNFLLHRMLITECEKQLNKPWNSWFSELVVILLLICVILLVPGCAHSSITMQLLHHQLGSHSMQHSQRKNKLMSSCFVGRTYLRYACSYRL